MDELVPPDGQGIALAMLYVLGNSFIFGLGRRAGGADLWLAFLLALAAALPILLLNIRLRKSCPVPPFGTDWATWRASGPLALSPYITLFMLGAYPAWLQPI